MALTREYKKTVVARIQRDEKFARALYAEALNARLEGETAEGLSMLRDLVHAQISFKELARQTGLGEKTLHRMLSRRGNPTTRNLVAIESYGTRHRSAFEFCFRNQPSVAIVVSQDGGIKTVTRVGKHIYFWENIFFDASTEICLFVSRQLFAQIQRHRGLRARGTFLSRVSNPPVLATGKPALPLRLWASALSVKIFAHVR